jgi:wobble nucleotide-excising tRNase
MLKKIVTIKNIGTFRNSQAFGNIELRRLTLIHAENGRGKTTLCAILRSLQCDNPNLILERKTLDSNDAPHIDILLDTGIATFKNGTWVSNCQHIEIFDTTFVADNVHTGDLITHDNKKNLCRVVLGAQGVQLAKKFDESDDQVRTRGSEMNAAKDIIQKLLPNGITFEQFIGLPRDPDIDLKIAEKKGEINVVKDSAAVREKQTLALLDLPQPSTNLTNTLQKTVEGISDDAEKIVRQHVERHKMAARGETWLAEGLRYATEKNCPFCAQSLEGSPIIQVFKIFFGQAYRNFLQELTQLKEAVGQPLSDAVLLTVQKRLADNTLLVEFWKNYVADTPGQLSFNERIQPVIRGLRDALAPLVSRKLESPLEKVIYSEAASSAVEEWKKLRDEVQRYNEEVKIFNTSINTVKTAIGTKNLMTLQRELTILETQKFRHEQPSIDAVNAYSNAKETKSKAEEIKNEAKEELNAYNAAMIDEYRGVVNDLLARFGAAFTLGNIKVEYMGRTPRTAYTFEIRGKEIDIGGDKTPAGTACFRNTLSAGDRSTLALAFFIAQLRNRKDLANLIVIFDDPFTSLDAFRQNWTCNMIRNFAKEAKQVIVLSHSLDFLRLLAERCDKAVLSTLQIDRHNRIDSQIVELDLYNAVMALVDKDVVQVRNFCYGDDKDADKTIRCIRPLLENYIRKVAPDACPEGNGWLGTFLSSIHKANESSPLDIFKPIYDELEHLNLYTRPYAHDSGFAPPVNTAELTAAAQLTLELIGRL